MNEMLAVVFIAVLVVEHILGWGMFIGLCEQAWGDRVWVMVLVTGVGTFVGLPVLFIFTICMIGKFTFMPIMKIGIEMGQHMYN